MKIPRKKELSLKLLQKIYTIFFIFKYITLIYRTNFHPKMKSNKIVT